MIDVVDLHALTLDQREALARITLAAAGWRIGDTLTGVTPDAEGPGQPSMQLARRF